MITKIFLSLLLVFTIVSGMSCTTSPSDDRDLMACVNILRQIETAKRTMAMGHSLENGELLTPEQVESLSTFMTGGKWSAHQCPSGGRYTVGRIGQPPSCSIHGNSKDIHIYY
ncbi:MAG: hypothetical protein PHR77_22440 [Kiritimatiellae bacterium]|nr:hypothetical protein [Kiritimatiellia bacterium]MDD5520348.1 hypothetical protein [Kiritimatiellia bacterium]